MIYEQRRSPTLFYVVIRCTKFPVRYYQYTDTARNVVNTFHYVLSGSYNDGCIKGVFWGQCSFSHCSAAAHLELGKPHVSVILKHTHLLGLASWLLLLIVWKVLGLPSWLLPSDCVEGTGFTVLASVLTIF